MSITTTFDFIGEVRNIGLKNELLVIELTKAFIDCLEFMQGELLGKMDADRKKTDALKERLKWQQNAARTVKDPEKDDKNYNGLLTFDASSVPPFPGMEKVDFSGLNQNDDISKHVSNLVMGADVGGMSLRQFLAAGGTAWKVPAGKDALTGKQLFTYYDQQAEYTKSAITALNSLTSQDNLTLQSLRSKIESVTQFLSTLMKNGYDSAASVLRNIPTN